MEKNKPYVKEFNDDGTVKDVFPYLHSSHETRAMRRGNQKLFINDLGQVSILRRVKSAKRKRDWI